MHKYSIYYKAFIWGLQQDLTLSSDMNYMSSTHTPPTHTHILICIHKRWETHISQKHAAKGRSGGAAEQLLPPSHCLTVPVMVQWPFLHEPHDRQNPQVSEQEPAPVSEDSPVTSDHFVSLHFRTLSWRQRYSRPQRLVWGSLILPVSKNDNRRLRCRTFRPTVSTDLGGAINAMVVCVQRVRGYFDLVN